MKLNGVIYSQIGNELCVGLNNDVDNNAAAEGVTLKQLVLPSYVSNLPVTMLGKFAFRKNPSLVTVFIPKTVKTIEYDALAHISTLIEVIFEPGIKLKSCNRGFLFNTSVKYVAMPPTINFFGQYSFGLTCIEDLVYCSNTEANFQYLFNANNQHYYPKRIHVKKTYSYPKFGSFSDELLKDGLCESLFPSVHLCTKHQQYGMKPRITILLLIIFS